MSDLVNEIFHGSLFPDVAVSQFMQEPTIINSNFFLIRGKPHSTPENIDPKTNNRKCSSEQYVN